MADERGTGFGGMAAGGCCFGGEDTGEDVEGVGQFELKRLSGKTE